MVFFVVFFPFLFLKLERLLEGVFLKRNKHWKQKNNEISHVTWIYMIFAFRILFGNFRSHVSFEFPFALPCGLFQFFGGELFEEMVHNKTNHTL